MNAMLTQSDEQRMLVDMVDGLLTAHGHIWSSFAEQGLLAMPFAAAEGGLDSSPGDLALVMDALGRADEELPFLASAIIGSRLVRDLANQAQRFDWIPQITAGTMVLALAHAEPGQGFGSEPVDTVAKPTANGFLLNGRKAMVLGGKYATHFLVSANGPAGLCVFLVPADAAGVAMSPHWIGDGAELTLTGAEVSTSSLLAASDVAAALATALDHGLAGLVAGAVGTMEQLHRLTTDYLKTRKQFGVTIGSFQALQHRAVDMLIELEQARSMRDHATAALDANPAIRRRAVIAAKAYVDGAARLLGETAVQLHGAIGMTLESPAGRLFRRLSAAQMQLCDRTQCLHELSLSPASLLEEDE